MTVKSLCMYPFSARVLPSWRSLFFMGVSALQDPRISSIAIKPPRAYSLSTRQCQASFFHIISLVQKPTMRCSLHIVFFFLLFGFSALHPTQRRNQSCDGYINLKINTSYRPGTWTRSIYTSYIGPGFPELRADFEEIQVVVIRVFRCSDEF